MQEAVRERTTLRMGLRTDPGRQRPVNEDSLGGPEGIPPELLERKGWLFVVADGMGGHVAGRVASDVAVRAVIEAYYADPSPDVARSLRAAVQKANAAVYARAREPGQEGMGTTLVAGVLRGEELHVANVGDSRAYLIRGGQITQISEDHSWVAEQQRAGLLSAEEARGHPYSNLISRSLGAGPDVEVDLFEQALYPGDAVLLCSDGLWGLVRDAEMQRVVASHEPQRAADELIALANRRGGDDNISAVVIAVGRGRPPRGGRSLMPVLAMLLFAGVSVMALYLARSPRQPAQPTPVASAAMLTAVPTASATATPTLPPTATAVPSRTPTSRPTATSTPMPTPTFTSTPTPVPTKQRLLVNSGFEEDGGWRPAGDCLPDYSNERVNNGQRSMRLGFSAGCPDQSHSTVAQRLTIPPEATQAELSFWYDSEIGSPWGPRLYLRAYRCSDYHLLAQLDVYDTSAPGWTQGSWPLSNTIGKCVEIVIGAFDDEYGDTTVWIDDLELWVWMDG